MLVLSRKKNESIVINDDITILVVEIRGDKVRLGIEAPKEVPVHRREVFDAIHRNEEKKDDDDDSSQGKGAPLPNPTPSSPPTSAVPSGSRSSSSTIGPASSRPLWRASKKRISRQYSLYWINFRKSENY